MILQCGYAVIGRQNKKPTRRGRRLRLPGHISAADQIPKLGLPSSISFLDQALGEISIENAVFHLPKNPFFSRILRVIPKHEAENVQKKAELVQKRAELVPPAA